jgi:hypothetical protein
VLSWTEIQDKRFAHAEAQWNLCETFGLSCPFDVFEQLFYDHHGDEDFGSVVVHVDWSRVRWRECLMSADALKRVAVPRLYQMAVDEARARTELHGVSDERAEVMDRWEEEGTWIRAPVLVSGSVLGSGVDLEILVGFTRLGNLLGLLEQRLVPQAQRHRVWVGELEVSGS